MPIDDQISSITDIDTFTNYDPIAKKATLVAVFDREFEGDDST